MLVASAAAVVVEPPSGPTRYASAPPVGWLHETVTDPSALAVALTFVGGVTPGHVLGSAIAGATADASSPSSVTASTVTTSGSPHSMTTVASVSSPATSPSRAPLPSRRTCRSGRESRRST